MILSIAATLVAVIAIAWLWPLLHSRLHNPFDDQSFDQSKWTAAASAGGWRKGRGPMAEDLRKRFLPEGMTRGDVHKLLGEPGSDGREQRANEDWYYLGVWGSMSIDGDYLIVRYDTAGRITSTEIYEH